MCLETHQPRIGLYVRIWRPVRYINLYDPETKFTELGHVITDLH